MKGLKKLSKNTLIICMAVTVANIISNSTCYFFAYQKEIPESVKRLRKF